MAKLNELISNQNETTIQYKDGDETKTRKVVLQEPSARSAAMILNNMAGANNTVYMGNIMELVMENAIVSPKLSYEILNKQVPAKLSSKTVELTNGFQKKVKFKMKFPDWKTALNLMTALTKTDGSYDFVGMLDDLLGSMLYDTEDKKLTWDWFNDHEKGYGLMNDVIRECSTYLNDVTNRDGIYQVLNAGFRLVQRQITRVR